MTDNFSIPFSRFNLAKIIKNFIFFLFAIILCLPLLPDIGNYLFPLGRDIIFKLLVELSVILTFLYWLIGNLKLNFKPRLKSNFVIPGTLILFLLISALSTLTSLQPSFSFWGNIYKNMGLFSLIHFVIFFFLLFVFLKQEKDWQKFLKLTAIVALLVSLFAIFQALSGVPRPPSTLNNPDFLSPYLVLVIPIFVALFFSSSKIFGFAAGTALIALFLTQTRSAYLGIFVSLLVFLFLFPFKKKGIKRNIFLIFLTGFVLFSLFFFTSSGQKLINNNSSFNQRFLNLEHLKSSFIPRWQAQQSGWEGLTTRPLLGYGPENFFIPFDSFYQGTLDQTGSLSQPGSLDETWFDKAHNFIFDIGATTGLFGLLIYISIFLSAIYLLFKRLKQSPSNPYIYIALISSFSGYLVQNLLNFDTTVPFIYLMFFLSYANFKINEHSSGFVPQKAEQETGPFSQKHSFSFVFLNFFGLALIILLIFYPFLELQGHIFQANYYLNQGETYCRYGEFQKCFQSFEKGLSYNAKPINPHLRRRYGFWAVSFLTLLPKFSEVNPKSSFDPYLIRALHLQEENGQNEFPYFTRNYIYAGQISIALYQELSINLGLVDIPDYLEIAKQNFQRASALSPNRQSIHTEWSRLLNLK